MGIAIDRRAFLVLVLVGSAFTAGC